MLLAARPERLLRGLDFGFHAAQLGFDLAVARFDLLRVEVVEFERLT